MTRKKSVTPTFKELLEDLKPMTFGQKLDHLWTYYKEYLLVVFLAALVIAITITGIINNSKEVLFKGMMVNISISQEGYRYLSDDYLTALGGDPKKQVVHMDYTNFSDLADPTSSEDNYTASLLLMARVSGQLLDCALIDQMAFEFYLTQEVYGDLSTFFTQEELDAMGDKVIYAMQEGETVRWPVAIDVSEVAFFAHTAPENDKIYFILSGNHPNLDACRSFWNYIHAWQPQED